MNGIQLLLISYHFPSICHLLGNCQNRDHTHIEIGASQQYKLKIHNEYLTKKISQIFIQICSSIRMTKQWRKSSLQGLKCVSTSIFKLFVEVEDIIRTSALLKDGKEESWICASFVSTYFAGIESLGFFHRVSYHWIKLLKFARHLCLKAIFI